MLQSNYPTPAILHIAHERGSASLSQLPRSPVGSTTWQELRARSALNLGAKAGRSPGAAPHSG